MPELSGNEVSESDEAAGLKKNSRKRSSSSCDGDPERGKDVYYAESRGGPIGDHIDHIYEAEFMEMPSDVYSTGMMSAIKDIVDIFHHGYGHVELKVIRMIISSLVVLFTVFIQIFLIIEVKYVVVAKSVVHAREVYNEFETHMFTKTTITVNGFRRGVPGTFRGQDAFDTLDEDTKDEICDFPLSHPYFTFVVLLVWSLACFAEVMRCFQWMRRFLFITETTTTLADVYDEKWKVGEDGVPRVKAIYVKRLTLPLKGCVFILLTIQACTALCLLWIGCRWLLATLDVSEVILNALALTFIVELKDMMYRFVLPRLLHQATESMKIKRDKIQMDCFTLLTPVATISVSIVWVYLYMKYLQGVLPDYRWDVRTTCDEYLRAATSD